MKERLLVLAKAYPEYSTKYGTYLLCTAGITEEGEWRRIFPIPMNTYLKIGKFSKRDWIEYEIKNTSPEYRKESRKIHGGSIKKVGKEKEHNVINMLREKITTLEKLNEEKEKNNLSLGVIKPIISSFALKERDTKEGEKFYELQQTLVPTFKREPIDKWPRYELFKCGKNCNKTHNAICEDIEVTELYRKVKNKYSDKHEDVIFLKVKQKLFDFMKKRDLYFIMGTHARYKTWLIISLIYPKYLGEPLNSWLS